MYCSKGCTGHPVHSSEHFRWAQRELFSTTTARVADDDREILDADLMIDEFVTAIKSMSLYKAPGLDGIPAKVYQLAPLLFA